MLEEQKQNPLCEEVKELVHHLNVFTSKFRPPRLQNDEIDDTTKEL